MDTIATDTIEHVNLKLGPGTLRLTEEPGGGIACEIIANRFTVPRAENARGQIEAIACELHAIAELLHIAGDDLSGTEIAAQVEFAKAVKRAEGLDLKRLRSDARSILACLQAIDPGCLDFSDAVHQTEQIRSNIEHAAKAATQIGS